MRLWTWTLAIAVADLPPTQLRPSFTGSRPPFVHSLTFSLKPFPSNSFSVTTIVAPRSSNSFFNSSHPGLSSNYINALQTPLLPQLYRRPPDPRICPILYKPLPAASPFPVHKILKHPVCCIHGFT